MPLFPLQLFWRQLRCIPYGLFHARAHDDVVAAVDSVVDGVVDTEQVGRRKLRHPFGKLRLEVCRLFHALGLQENDP